MDPLEMLYRILGKKNVTDLSFRMQEYIVQAYKAYEAETQHDTSIINIRPVPAPGSRAALEILVSLGYFLMMENPQDAKEHGGYRITEDGRHAAKRVIARLDREARAEKQRQFMD